MASLDGRGCEALESTWLWGKGFQSLLGIGTAARLPTSKPGTSVLGDYARRDQVPTTDSQGKAEYPLFTEAIACRYLRLGRYLAGIICRSRMPA